MSENLWRSKFGAMFMSKRNAVLIIVVVAISIVLAVISYQHYSAGSEEIRELAEEDIRSNTRITSHDLSNVMTQRLRIVGTQLQTLAESPLIQNNDFERTRNVINDRQATTPELTEFYMWLDHNGRLLWISNLNQTYYETYSGTDLSDREYFSIPRDTGESYFSSVLTSNDGVPRIYISVPIFDEHGVAFRGVAVAAIRPTAVGELLRSDLAPGTESLVSLVDRNGIILYSRNIAFIGEDIFGQEVQDAISSQILSDEVDLTNNVLRLALQGNSGVEDITVLGQVNTLAYNPVTFNGHFVMTLYITSPHVLASSAQTIIDQQQALTVAIILVVTAVASTIAILVLTWNNQLDIVVRERTAALQASNKQLEGANEQLKIHDAMQREFINIAAHELRTPTQAILGYSELIDSGLGLAEKDLQGIHRNAKRLERLTEDILDVTRIEANTLKLKKERFSLNEVISSLISDLQQDPQTNKDKKFYFGTKFDAVVIEADKGRITQVISNILSNAVKFSNETGDTISVSVEEMKNNDVGRQIVVRIRDEGIGIHADILPRLFSKFTPNSEKGTGLGLYISKSIIEAHGGKIWAENNKDGNGATFSFSLPYD